MQQQMQQHQLGFPVIADPEQALYALYGVEASWLGFLRGAMQVKKYNEAKALGFAGGAMDGNKARLPADFLLDEQLTVARTFYGQRIDEHLPIGELKQWLEGGQVGKMQLGLEH